MIKQLGRFNFTDLALVLWKSNDHFNPFQDFLVNYFKETYLSLHRPGVISGCKVTPVSGLTVRISEGLVLFDNEELVTVAQQDITLTTADPTDPRIDRLILTHSVQNNVVVQDKNGVNRNLDKFQVGTGTSQTGTPAPAPSAPVKTVGAISLATINIAATQTILSASDIDSRETSREISRKVENTETVENIVNNQAAQADVPLLRFDKTKHRAVFVDYHLRRRTDTALSEVVTSGRLYLRFKTDGDEWELTDDSRGDDVIGVDFFVIPSTGQVQFTSTNIAGANYVGEISYMTKTLDI